jgi:uncharacterized cupredoxin-like copper-binding protein
VPAAHAEDIDVQLHEVESGGFHILPDAMNAQKGETLNLTVTNQGKIAHDLVVCGDGPVPPTDCQDVWGFIAPLQAGQTARLTATAKKAGTFTYYCSLPGHAAGGMRGTLTVQGDNGSSKPSPGTALVGTLMSLAVVAFLVRRERS